MICNNIFISPIMIRPDKRIQSTTMKTQDDYTISLQGIIRLGMKLNELSPNDPQFDKIYDSLIQTMQNYHKGSQEDDSN
jgi:hypothetical protein